MRSMRIAGATVVGLLLAVGACSNARNTMAVKQLAPLSVGQVRRLAVMPFVAGPGVGREPAAAGQEPVLEPPAQTVETAVRDGLALYADWQVVGQQVTADVVQKILGTLRAPTEAEAVAIGRALEVDAVLRGQVLIFVERIGTDLGVQRPAHVAFAVELVDAKSGVAAWQASFNQQQEALSDNLLNLRGFVKTRGRWVRARDLAVIGANQTAYALHVALFGEQATPKPRTAKQD